MKEHVMAQEKGGARCVVCDRRDDDAGFTSECTGSAIPPEKLQALRMEVGTGLDTRELVETRMVANLAPAMLAKLARAREKGRGGWQRPEECSVTHLWDCLQEHILKENMDMVDVVNFAGFIWWRLNHVEGDRALLKAHMAQLARPKPVSNSDLAEVLLLAEMLEQRNAFLSGVGDLHPYLETLHKIFRLDPAALRLLAQQPAPESGEGITVDEFIRREGPNWEGVDAVAFVRALRGDAADEPQS